MGRVGFTWRCDTHSECHYSCSRCLFQQCCLSNNCELLSSCFRESSQWEIQTSLLPFSGWSRYCQLCYGSSVDITNPTESMFGAYSLFDNNAVIGSNPDSYSSGKSGGRYYTIQLCSVLFGGMADKYLPMSAINGVRITLSCENVIGAFVINGFEL